MTSIALRVYTAVVAIVCAGAIAFTLNQQHLASSWQAEARGWQVLAAKTVHQNRLVARRARMLVVRYDRLVMNTKRSQRRLLKALASSRPAAPVYTPSTVSTVSAAPAPAPAPVAAPPAPVTRTS